MVQRPLAMLALAMMMLGASSSVLAQSAPDSKALIAAERQAMNRFDYMDGVWRGDAWTILQSGEKHSITQTERIGPFLDGAVKVIEGRGYEPNGAVSFNAFATISYDPAKQAYTLHSHALGYVGDFVLTPTADGYVWELPMGPMTIRYTAVIKDGAWHEVGDRVIPGRDPVRIFEMNLKRIGNSTWPAAGAIEPK